MTAPATDLRARPHRQGPRRRSLFQAAAGMVACGGGSPGGALVAALVGSLAAAQGGAARADVLPPVSPVSAPRSDHFPFGALGKPRHLQAWPLRLHDGRATDLARLLAGRTTALQLMFTGCSATCPIQGALFAQAQRELMGKPASVQFLSLSIDPLSDTPAALAAWLRRFGAAPGWLAASPRPADLDALVQRLTTEGEPLVAGGDSHSGQVMLIDRRGDLVYRTPSFPTASRIVEMLRLIDARP